MCSLFHLISRILASLVTVDESLFSSFNKCDPMRFHSLVHLFRFLCAAEDLEAEKKSLLDSSSLCLY